ncbi:hypothetical protein Goshw_013232 [Gossypium schwendimanii]|uniref:Uncharacterized protein n=1 Tax=Gossypium schwendimanii TaxID=34291 RepID=A0A7J9MN85_GOSSC|nr:hypothetical protein [Gossypium schwendimanii]
MYQRPEGRGFLSSPSDDIMQKCWGYNGSKLVIHEADEELNRFPDTSEMERDIKILERNYKRCDLGHRVDDKVDVGDGPDWIGVCMEKWYENTKFIAKQIWLCNPIIGPRKKETKKGRMRMLQNETLKRRRMTNMRRHFSRNNLHREGPSSVK